MQRCRQSDHFFDKYCWNSNIWNQIMQIILEGETFWVLSIENEVLITLFWTMCGKKCNLSLQHLPPIKSCACFFFVCFCCSELWCEPLHSLQYLSLWRLPTNLMSVFWPLCECCHCGTCCFNCTHQEKGNFLSMSFHSFFNFQKLRKEIEKLMIYSFCVPFGAWDSFQKVIWKVQKLEAYLETSFYWTFTAFNYLLFLEFSESQYKAVFKSTKKLFKA